MLHISSNLRFIKYIQYIELKMILSGALLQILAFYFVLAFIVFPLIAYFVAGKNSRAVGNGWAVGSIVSVVLWYAVGRNMV